MPKEKLQSAIKELKKEADERAKYFRENGKLIEAQRITERVNYDTEMLSEIGFCKGIENYSRVLSGRAPGSMPFTLFDYLPKRFLMFIDESHVTLPQVRAMYARRQITKRNFNKLWFQTPSAYDNRPMNFDEFYSKINQVVFVSATPGDFELEKSQNVTATSNTSDRTVGS